MPISTLATKRGILQVLVALSAFAGGMFLIA
jgi:hypothetical protein